MKLLALGFFVIKCVSPDEDDYAAPVQESLSVEISRLKCSSSLSFLCALGVCHDFLKCIWGFCFDFHSMIYLALTLNFRGERWLGPIFGNTLA